MACARERERREESGNDVASVRRKNAKQITGLADMFTRNMDVDVRGTEVYRLYLVVDETVFFFIFFSKTDVGGLSPVIDLWMCGGVSVSSSAHCADHHTRVALRRNQTYNPAHVLFDGGPSRCFTV